MSEHKKRERLPYNQRTFIKIPNEIITYDFTENDRAAYETDGLSLGLIGDVDRNKDGDYSYRDDSVKCNPYLISTYIYITVCRSIDLKVRLTINDLVSWCGYKPDNHIGKINSKFRDALCKLCEEQFIILDDECLNKISTASANEMITLTFNFDRYDLQNNRYTILYLDEIERIRTVKTKNDIFISNLFFIMAFIRMSIGLSKFYHGVEFYTAFNKNLSALLHMKSNTFSNIVAALVEMNLLFAPQYKWKDKDKERFRVSKVEYCNYDKRDEYKILKSGESYYKELKSAYLKSQQKNN